jgi:AcrR family transcriptional regulator
LAVVVVVVFDELVTLYAVDPHADTCSCSQSAAAAPAAAAVPATARFDRPDRVSCARPCAFSQIFVVTQIDAKLELVCTAINMKSTRSYTMRARAASTAQTREQILNAVVALSEERLSVEIVLADVAARAGVSVQTVLRHFSSKDELFEQAQARQVARVRADRATPVGDLEAAVETIVGFYDRLGAWSVRLQAQEHTDDLTRRTVVAGRRIHRDWVAEVFAPQLAGCDDREELIDLLVVATDVLTWKILHRDIGLDRASTRQRMLRLVTALVADPPDLPEGS